MSETSLLRLVADLRGEKTPSRETIRLVNVEVDKATLEVARCGIPKYWAKGKKTYINEIARRRLVEIVMA